jgi:hypothetical protein
MLGIIWMEDPNLTSFFHVMEACRKTLEKNPSLKLSLIRAESLGSKNDKGYKIYEEIFMNFSHSHIISDLKSIHYLATYNSLVKSACEGNLVIAGKVIDLKDLRYLMYKSKILNNCGLLEKLGLVNHWISEHEIKGHIFSKYKMRDAKDKHIPDAIFDSEVAGYKVANAVELELTLKSKGRYKKIINQYLYKDDLHSVWYFVNSRSVLNILKDQFSKEYSSFSQVKIFFTLLSDLKTNGVNAKMIGLKSTSLIKNYFSNAIDSAHTTAYKVSMLNENMVDGNINLTSQNHTPILDSGFI